MESIHSIFNGVIEQNKDNPNFDAILQDVVFELSKKKIQRLKDEKNIQNRLSELFELYVKELQTQGMENAQTVGAVIDGIIKACICEKEELLYKQICEKDLLEKLIAEQKKSIQSTIFSTFETLEEHIEKMDASMGTQALKALHDAKLKGLEMLGILRETISEALLNTIETGNDIEETVFEIIKNMTYQTINEGEFRKKRFLDIADTIIDITMEIADADQSFAKEILGGTIYGVKEGTVKAIDKFKNDLKFAPQEILEQDLRSIKKELLSIEEDYITLLQTKIKSSNGTASKIAQDILDTEFSTSFIKIKRVVAEAREAINDKLTDFKESADGIEYDFVEKAEAKIQLLKSEMTKLEKKAGSKFESLKKEISELENNASEKLEALKKFEFENENAKKAASEAKRLGKRAFEVAKNVLDNALKSAKDAINKNDK
ncbi:MAG: hypothetical protein IBX44_10385 [Sulfurospirillum sp.]|nr:hypothetical protein [Sulfurospirillum sp.]